MKALDKAPALTPSALFTYSYPSRKLCPRAEMRKPTPAQVITVPFKRLSPALVFFAALLALPAYTFTPVSGRKGMVASSEPLASQVGVEILQEGGNAVDAAVAVGFTLAVTFPQAGNLGGGGFMLIRMARGDAVVVDYREQAPAAATRGMYQGGGGLILGASTTGARAAAVPG